MTIPSSTSAISRTGLGEQALFVFDGSTRTATLYLGDAGWETRHAVTDAEVLNLVLGEAELLWLRAC